ncbi:hypothetical protein ACSBR2_008546 [Camellia fascicularis]
MLTKYRFPRMLMMTLVLFLPCISLLFIAFPVASSVYVVLVIIGFSFGVQLPLIFTIISELFGLKYYSTLFNCGQLASPLGSYILNVKVTGPLYDHKALKELERKGLSRSSVVVMCLEQVGYVFFQTYDAQILALPLEQASQIFPLRSSGHSRAQAGFSHARVGSFVYKTSEKAYPTLKRHFSRSTGPLFLTIERHFPRSSGLRV